MPRIGRWASPDPLHIHAVGGGEALNSYHYIAGNLLQGSDPIGLCEDPAGCESKEPVGGERRSGGERATTSGSTSQNSRGEVRHAQQTPPAQPQHIILPNGRAFTWNQEKGEYELNGWLTARVQQNLDASDAAALRWSSGTTVVGGMMLGGYALAGGAGAAAGGASEAAGQVADAASDDNVLVGIVARGVTGFAVLGALNAGSRTVVAVAEGSMDDASILRPPGGGGSEGGGGRGGTGGGGPSRPRYVPRDEAGNALPLPTTPGGEPAPSSPYPHTQIGTGTGRTVGEYPQTRRFGAGGRPVHRVDWTDHGRPALHTDPHVHDSIPNSTGGTPRNGPARPPRPDDFR